MRHLAVSPAPTKRTSSGASSYAQSKKAVDAPDTRRPRVRTGPGGGGAAVSPGCRAKSRSDGGVTSIDQVIASGHKGRVVRQQEADEVGDFRRGTQAVESVLALQDLKDLRAEAALHERRPYVARAYRVDAQSLHPVEVDADDFVPLVEICVPGRRLLALDSPSTGGLLSSTCANRRGRRLCLPLELPVGNNFIYGRERLS